MVCTIERALGKEDWDWERDMPGIANDVSRVRAEQSSMMSCRCGSIFFFNDVGCVAIFLVEPLTGSMGRCVHGVRGCWSRTTARNKNK